MTYHEAKEILRDASGIQSGRDLRPRLVASAGRLSPFDSSTIGELPEGDTLGDQMLRSLLIVRRHLVEIERDLALILLQLVVPVRVLAADPRYADTRIPQISLAFDIIILSLHANAV
jgi:hypothetical protein